MTGRLAARAGPTFYSPPFPQGYHLPQAIVSYLYLTSSFNLHIISFFPKINQLYLRCFLQGLSELTNSKY